MSKVLIVEPHGDDALCSCSSVLRSDKFEVYILTLSERSSKGLEKIYPSVNGVRFLNLEDLSFYDRPKITTYDIHRRFLQEEDVYEYYLNLSKDSFDLSWIKSVNKISDSISDIILNGGYDYILIPVGLNHPYHIVTRLGVESAYDDIINSFKSDDCVDLPTLVYYVDKPYYQNRYVKEMLESFIRSRNYSLFISPEVDKEEQVKLTFKEVYPTELGMLRFSSDILLKGSDIFLHRVADDTNVFKESLK